MVSDNDIASYQLTQSVDIVTGSIETNIGC